MQSKLPDINSAIVRHRGGALIAVASTPPNFTLAASELSAINSLLPEEFTVKISTLEYNRLIKGEDIVECPSCNKETPYISITFIDKTLSSSLQLLCLTEKILMWNCPNCHVLIPKDGIDRKIRKFQKPFYTGFMPECPKRDSFGNSLAYRLKFEFWFDIALNELEYLIGKYRAEYASQQTDGSVTIQDEDDN